MRQKLNPYKPGDPRYYPTVVEELKMTQDLDFASIRRLHSDFLGTEAGQLAVVGDFDEDAVVKSMKDILADWTAKQPYERLKRSGKVDVKADTLTIVTPDKANAFYFSGEVFPLSDSDPDYPALVIGNYVFGAGNLSSRLGDRIRQKEGLSYGVGSAFGAARWTSGRRCQSTPSAIPKTFPRFRPASARNSTSCCRKASPTRSSSRPATAICSGRKSPDRRPDARPHPGRNAVCGPHDGILLALEQRIHSLTQDDVEEALRKYVKPKHFYTAIAGDFREDKPSNEDGDDSK